MEPKDAETEINGIFEQGRKRTGSFSKKEKDYWETRRKSLGLLSEESYCWAISKLEKLIKGKGDCEENHLLLAKAYRGELEKLSETGTTLTNLTYHEIVAKAMKSYENVLGINLSAQTYKDYINFLGNVKRENSNIDFTGLAIKLGKEAIVHYYNSAELHLELYKLYKKKGDWLLAYNSMAQATRLKYADADFLLNNFGDDLWRNGPSVSGKVKLIDFALERNKGENLDFMYKLVKYYIKESPKPTVRQLEYMIQLLDKIITKDRFYENTKEIMEDVLEARILLTESEEERKELQKKYNEIRAMYNGGAYRDKEDNYKDGSGKNKPELSGTSTVKVPEADTKRDKVTKKIYLTRVLPKAIKKKLDEYVVGQEEAKMVLSTALYNHNLRLDAKSKGDDTIEKSNVLLIGNTGVGKTFLARTLARIANLPFIIFDIKSLTEAGYIGSKVEDICESLYFAAKKNIELAQKGIAYLDEIDKLRVAYYSSGRDVSGRGSQQNLLSIIEGTVASVQIGADRERINFNTTDVLFICGGSFSGDYGSTSLKSIINGEDNSKKITGFGEGEAAAAEKFSKIMPEHLIKFGMIPELVSRIPAVISLDDLTQKELKRILIEPKDALVKQYGLLFKEGGINLSFTDNALELIAAEAIKRKQGARSLRSLCEQILSDYMFHLPGSGVRELMITKAIVEEKLSK